MPAVSAACSLAFDRQQTDFASDIDERPSMRRIAALRAIHGRYDAEPAHFTSARMLRPAA
ncbi:hypothetical protein DNK06_18660 [Pseudomonas daroniae]|uniref:Uncharacterized protein n=1 Tax=Phytopseudomonas daroniae TaxID=2487519 RepID=A0A4Q9QIV0_9GAMM|nr:hypothetical protein DNK06_18660 [Pseudomonas daroniae]TBU79971.1 hypothetical protein DNK31_18390 [Pseudomonas sp. FRB 228]TBU88895.1 hypothetical protein DNJ99_17830 [Pseudomonas daroniae]